MFQVGRETAKSLILCYVSDSPLWFAEFIVIHNGIITNYKDLKKFLVSRCFSLIFLDVFSLFRFVKRNHFLVCVGEQRL